MTDPFVKAKESLLASGLPLELSVERRLRRMGFQNVTADFSYWRRSEVGHKDFSVDIRASRSLATPWVTEADNYNSPLNAYATWDVLIECKYRKPNVKWLFAPMPPPLPSQWLPERHSHFFFNGRGQFRLGSNEAGHLDVLTKQQRETTESSPEAPPIAYVTRGVEMRPASGGNHDANDDAFSAPIKRGVYQLQFAHVPRLNTALADVGLMRWVSESQYAPRQAHIHISTLVLVTTAELWTFLRDVDLEDIEKAASLKDIAEQVNAVEYATVASRELRAHQQEWLTAMERQMSFGPPEHEPSRRQLWQTVTNLVVGASPSVFIVNTHQLEATLEHQKSALQQTIHNLMEVVAREKGFIIRPGR